MAINQAIPKPLPGIFPSLSPEELAEMERLDTLRKAERMKFVPRFQEGNFQSTDATVPYRLYIPEDNTDAIPMLIILHGIGGCGNDNLGQILDNDSVIDWVKAQDDGSIPPCAVLAPQCPLPIPNVMWEIPYLEAIRDGLESVVKESRADISRIYLTGLSLGGFGAWNLNRLAPDRFAAVITCCPACIKGEVGRGTIDSDGLSACVDTLVKVPLWMFHAEDDPLVPVAVTQKMRELLNEKGKTEGDSFKVTIYPAEQKYNHGCWDPAYKDREMFTWLFSQRKDK